MVLEELKKALTNLENGINDGDSDVVKSSLVEIDRIRVEERKALDPQLKHYLKNRSYQKALMFLKGAGKIPAGRCSSGKPAAQN